MKNVAILAAENSVLSTIASPMDMFLQAGVLWNVTMGKMPSPLFNAKIVTSDGKPVNAVSNVPIIPACSMHDMEDPDLVIIPSQGFFFDPREKSHGDRINWLKHCYEKGSDLASVCGGAFTLASTGLLDGKTATTHWGLAAKFKRSFPNVNLRTDLLVTDEGRLFCGGGISADLNLSLYLIRKYCGREVALQSSRCTLVDLDSVYQSPFSVFSPEKNHSDIKILNAQEWMENNYRNDINVQMLANEADMSVRQFNRRFKAATNETVTKYHQLIRVEAAKTNLVNTSLSFEEISMNSGYENISFFRRVFKQNTSVTPAEYRRRFCQI
ncbi:helix-turn-helix domain-containing protein [Sneathiella marina]|uniref:Helix-turn-helix domain-containing protein n=1 Tax=Sneathiella marina TaxID=2950108 RepID=A0ABY4VYS3_9PROT|nr:helix-turn-helix domain-containing protein [Sneathiella marina]USG60081.1 helix-turn-helix domain-containing protein [Sneathiella marina]